MTGKHILVMDDDAELCQLVAEAAAEYGVACTIATDAQTFLAELTPAVSLILLDLVMPNVDGIELLRILGERQCTTQIVLMSGVGVRILQTANSLAQSHGLNVAGHLEKPFRLTELLHFLQAAPVIARAEPAATHNVQDGALRIAVQLDEFLLHYQPQIDIASGEVVGVEALVRWQHPQFGLIFPDSFIARCERLELIDLLGSLVADRGLSEIAPLRKRDGGVLSLSLNISPFSLLELSLPDALAGLARKYHRKPKDVVIEIVESSLVREASHTLDVLARLRMKGFQLSIDDFGKGFSMMEQLRNVPATEIKIDRSFVMNLPNKTDQITVLKTIEIGHELGLRVVAEGVETRQQLAFLRDKGCDIAQGYLFAKPLPLANLLTWLEQYDPALYH